MATGTLEISGSIDVSQFWPRGSSDADTVKLTLATPTTGFVFRPPDGKGRQTRAYVGAKVVGAQGAKPAINVSKKTGSAHVVVRLQGIDAPELHFRPTLEAGASRKAREAFADCNPDFRQVFAETAARTLGDFLGKGGALVPCVFRTVVDQPSDAADVYGRFVGDIYVKRGKREINVNRWLIAEGHVLPAFYNSMTRAEIETIRTLSLKAAKDKGDTVWRRYRETLGTFDWDLQFRKTGDGGSDTGKFIFPKLFRRLCVFEAKKCARLASGSGLAAMRKLTDVAYRLEDFLENGALSATPVKLGDLIDGKGRLSESPVDLVFQEKGSKLVDANRQEIRTW